MAPELGIFALILAFVLSVSQAFFGLTGAWRGNTTWPNPRAVATSRA